MSISGLFDLEIVTYLFAFGLTFYSGYLVYRQRLSSFQIVREFVLGVYFLIVILMSLDFLRVILRIPELMTIYPIASTSVGLAQATMLLAAAVAVYLGPTNAGFKSFPSILRRSWLHATIFSLFILVTVVAIVFQVIVRPATVVSAVDIAGRTIPAISISTNSLVLIMILLGFFLGYPVVLLLIAASKIQIPLFRRGLIVLPVGWALVSSLYVGIESYLWLYGVDATVILYSVNAVIFFVVTREFRISAILGGMVDSSSEQGRPSSFSTQLGRQSGFLRGTVSLFEVSPTTAYEVTLREVAYEFLSLKESVFVVTSKGSRVHKAVSDLDRIKIFAIASNVSYLVPTKKPGEVLIPSHDIPLLIDILYKASKSSPSNTTFILDSLSDMIFDAGFKETHQFVKQALETFSDDKITLIAVLFQDAHEVTIMNAIRSLFSNHVIEDAERGPRVSKYQNITELESDKEQSERDLS